jgi:hypothetical protein
MSHDNLPDLPSLANALGAAWPRTDQDAIYATAPRTATR